MTRAATRSPFQGRWRIANRELWDREAIDMVVPGYFSFDLDVDHGRMGHFQFIVVEGAMDCHVGARDGKPLVEFSWEGEDDGEPRCGRGWAVIEQSGTMAGRFFFHQGDDSGFTAAREDAAAGTGPEGGAPTGSRRPRARRRLRRR